MTGALCPMRTWFAAYSFSLVRTSIYFVIWKRYDSYFAISGVFQQVRVWWMDALRWLLAEGKITLERTKTDGCLEIRLWQGLLGKDITQSWTKKHACSILLFSWQFSTLVVMDAAKWVWRRKGTEQEWYCVRLGFISFHFKEIKSVLYSAAADWLVQRPRMRCDIVSWPDRLT